MKIDKINHRFKLIPLSRSFFRPRSPVVAKRLLEKLLVRRLGRRILVGKIIETEAYLSNGDKAAHVFRGKTKRTRILYGRPGCAYIFQLRKHFCFNAAVEPVGFPGCVLVRSVELLTNLPKPLIIKGPGKVCRAFDINLSLYGTDLINPKSPLQICRNHRNWSRQTKFKIATTTRIGITKDSDRKLRFSIKLLF